MQGCDELRMPVSEIKSRVSGQAIEVSATIHVCHPSTVTLGNNNGKGMVVVRRPVLYFTQRRSGEASVCNHVFRYPQGWIHASQETWWNRELV